MRAKLGSNWDRPVCSGTVVLTDDDGTELASIVITSVNPRKINVKEYKTEVYKLATEMIATINKGNDYAKKNTDGRVAILLQTLRARMGRIPSV